MYRLFGAMAEVNGVRPKLFILRKIKANPILHGVTLSGSNTPARYSAYVKDVTTYVKSNAEIDEGSKENRRCEEVTEPKINRKMSTDLRGWVRVRESLFPSFNQRRTSQHTVFLVWQ